MAALRDAAVSADPRKAFIEAWRDGKFNRVPGVSELENTRQGQLWHSEGNVLIHVSYVFANVVAVCLEMGLEIGSWGSNLLLATALWHDSQKPAAFQEVNGKITAHGHAELAAETAKKVAADVLGFDSNTVDALVWLVGNHMIAHDMPKWQIPKKGLNPRVEYYRHQYWHLLEAFEHADATGALRQDGQWGPGNRQYFQQDRPLLLGAIEKKEAAISRQRRITSVLRDRLGDTRNGQLGKLKEIVNNSLGQGEFSQAELEAAVDNAIGSILLRL